MELKFITTKKWSVAAMVPKLVTMQPAEEMTKHSSMLYYNQAKVRAQTMLSIWICLLSHTVDVADVLPLLA